MPYKTKGKTGIAIIFNTNILKAHDGEIIVETKEGEGTKFIILLPFV